MNTNQIFEGAYFDQHPDRVLGTYYETTNRWNKKIRAVKGSRKDVEQGINVLDAMPYDHFGSGDNRPAQQKEINKVTSKTKKAQTPNVPIYQGDYRPDLVSISESIAKYNPQLSEEEIAVFVTYQVLRGFYKKNDILKSDWAYYLKDEAYLKNQSSDLVAFDGERYVPAVLFYSGNIYAHALQMAENEKEIIEELGKERYEEQLAKIEQVKPTVYRLHNDEKTKLLLSPQHKIFRTFRIEELGSGLQFDEPELLLDIFEWKYVNRLKEADFVVGKDKSSSYDVRTKWLNRTNFPRGTSEIEKASRLRQAQIVGSHLFDRFLTEELTREDRTRIEGIWNSDHNNYVDVNPHKIPIGFEVNTRFKTGELGVRPAQREGVGFLNINGTGIIAYDVGVGKTMTSILALGDMMGKGLCKRPMIVVPNPTYDKWIGEIHGVFAKKDIKDKKTGKVLHEKGELLAEGVLPQYPINDFYNLGTQHKHKAVNRDGLTLTVGAYTITVVTYEALKHIGFSPETEGKLVQNIKQILSQGETGRDDAIIEEKIGELIDKSLDGSSVFIEDMGIDCIVVDEAHNFKNLFTQVRGEVAGDGERETSPYKVKNQANPSNRAINLFMLNRYIHLHFNRRNTIGLTATPFTNSPLEIYSMQALFDYDGLKEHGISNIKDYFDNFVNETYEAVWTTRGRLETRPVIRSFRNLSTMQSIIFKYILYKTGEEANIKRPTKIVLPLEKDDEGKVLPFEYQVSSKLMATPIQLSWFKDIAEFAKNKPSRISQYYPARNGIVPGRDLIAINAAQLVTLSPLLLPFQKVSPEDYTPEEFLETSPKLTYVMECIRTVKEYHEAKGEEVSGQVIYSNRGTGFFPHLKDYLVNNIGYKPDEVQLITGSTTQAKKEKYKKGFLEGQIKIIIGSSTIKEGIDLQNRSTILYNCFLDWNPTDIKQLEGRIWRFGNRYTHVRIVVPLIENSFDIFLNQKLSEKTSRINNIWSRVGREQVLKLDELNPEELKKGLITDPKDLAIIELQEKLQAISVKKVLLQSWVNELTDAAIKMDDAIKLKNKIEQYIEAANDIASYPYELEKEKKEKVMGMPTATIKEKYRKLKAYAKVRTGSIVWELPRVVDTHIAVMKDLARIERDILSKNSLNLGDDVTPLIAQFNAELEELRKEIGKIKDPQNQIKLIAKYAEEQAANKLASRPIDERVQEFERLNYLLECSSLANHRGNVCDIYGIKRGKKKKEISKKLAAAEIDLDEYRDQYMKRVLANPTLVKLAKKAYKALDEVIPLTQLPSGFYAGIEKSGFYKFSFEKQTAVEAFVRAHKGYYLIMEYTYVQNGDLMSVPRVDLGVYNNKKMIVPINYTNHELTKRLPNGDIAQWYTDFPAEKNFKELSDLLDFMVTWAKDLYGTHKVEIQQAIANENAKYRRTLALEQKAKKASPSASENVANELDLFVYNQQKVQKLRRLKKRMLRKKTA